MSADVMHTVVQLTPPTALVVPGDDNDGASLNGKNDGSSLHGKNDRASLHGKDDGSLRLLRHLDVVTRLKKLRLSPRKHASKAEGEAPSKEERCIAALQKVGAPEDAGVIRALVADSPLLLSDEALPPHPPRSPMVALAHNTVARARRYLRPPDAIRPSAPADALPRGRRTVTSRVSAIRSPLRSPVKLWWRTSYSSAPSTAAAVAEAGLPRPDKAGDALDDFMQERTRVPVEHI